MEDLALPGMTIEIVNWSEADEEINSGMKFDWEKHLEKLVREWVLGDWGYSRTLTFDDVTPATFFH